MIAQSDIWPWINVLFNLVYNHNHEKLKKSKFKCRHPFYTQELMKSETDTETLKRLKYKVICSTSHKWI